MTQEQLTAQVVIVGLTRYVSMVSVLPYRHAAVDAPRDQRVLMEYVFLLIHVAVDVPMGKHASTEYARQMIHAQTVAQMKSVLTEHASLIPVLIVKRMRYVSMESADRPEVMRTSDKLNLFKR